MLSSAAATARPPALSANLPAVVGQPVRMPSGAMANWLDHRLHLQHGPIDLIITLKATKPKSPPPMPAPPMRFAAFLIGWSMN